VDAAASALVGERARIDRVLRGFSLARSKPADVRKLRGVEAQLGAVAARVKALRPPADAGALHADVVRLLELETTVASHLAATAAFVPELNRTLTPVTPAGATLAVELKRAKTWQADSAAYAHYRVALAAVVDALAGLRPPPELRGTLAAQTRQLKRRAELSAGLADAFSRKDVKAVNAGLKGFAALSSPAETARGYRAQVAMTRAFNSRLDSISTLAVRIGRERQKLIATLG
jgi:hypothetical protein